MRLGKEVNSTSVVEARTVLETSVMVLVRVIGITAVEFDPMTVDSETGQVVVVIVVCSVT